MHEYGGGRVIRSLISYPCKLSTNAILATLPESIKKNEELEIYRIYVTESLKAYGEGLRLTESYEDLIHPKPKDRRSGEEIAADIIEKIGLEVV